MDYQHPTGNHPEIIDIVACGPTLRTYTSMRMDYNPVAPEPDEVWSLNKALRTIRCDLGFVMDDLVGEARKSERYRQALDALEVPVITSIIDTDVEALYPNLNKTEYPLDEVINHIGLRICRARSSSFSTEDVKTTGDINGYYLHNSIPYILAYALFIGVKRVQLFGADYTYPGMAAREDDRANTEYWVGLLRAYGVELWTTADTTLLNQTRQPWLYGYGARPPIREAPSVEWVEGEARRLYGDLIAKDSIPIEDHG